MAAGAKSQRAFMATAKHVALEADGPRLTLRPSRNLGPKDGFEPIEGQQTANLSGNPHEVGAALLSAFDEAF